MKKCICKSCDDCRLYLSWILTNDKGEKKVENKCSIIMVAEEIPRFRGSVDGLQSGVNESRNRSMETKNMVKGFITGLIGMATQKAIEK